MHDVTQRSTSNEVEGITSYQCDGRFSPRLENGDVVGWNYFNLVHHVMGAATLPMQINRIPYVNVLKPTEETVPVPGNANVSGFARSRRATDVADCSIQCEVVRSLQYWHLKLKRRDFKNSQRRRYICREAGFVGFDTLF